MPTAFACATNCDIFNLKYSPKELVVSVKVSQANPIAPIAPTTPNIGFIKNNKATAKAPSPNVIPASISVLLNNTSRSSVK